MSKKKSKLQLAQDKAQSAINKTNKAIYRRKFFKEKDHKTYFQNT